MAEKGPTIQEARQDKISHVPAKSQSSPGLVADARGFFDMVANQDIFVGGQHCSVMAGCLAAWLGSCESRDEARIAMRRGGVPTASM